MSGQNLHLEPLSILIVDDDSQVLKALERDLRATNQVETTSDTHEALAKMKSTEYCVVISDFKMPNMNGLEFLEECSKLRPDCQRLLLTAFNDFRDLSQVVNRAKLNGIMFKPWEKSELESCVKDLIRNNYLLRENAELRRMAWSDGLTGIPNHRYFWERLEAEFSRAKRYQRDLSLLMCDVDDFKVFNDTYGHPHGDMTLKKIALALDNAKRQMDCVARYGGEEFAVILPEVNHTQAVAIAQRMHKAAVEKTGVNLSIGVATFPQQAQSSTELLFLADKALLLAKSKGKNQVISCNDLPKK
jgi:two-component system cell cycle response regulator